MSWEDSNRIDLTGCWKLVKSEHFEDFLRELGVNFVVRKAVIALMSPKLTIEQKGDNFKISSSISFWTQVHKFTVGEEYEENLQGVITKCRAEWVEKKLVIHHDPLPVHNKPPHRIEREIVDGQLVQQLFVGDVVCTRIFAKENS